jgi:hypothetical protein
MSLYRMVLVHGDESQEAVDGGYDDLAEACRVAFRIAEDYGRRGNDGGAHPQWVSIFRGDSLELSVQVTPPPAVQSEHRVA